MSKDAENKAAKTVVPESVDFEKFFEDKMNEAISKINEQAEDIISKAQEEAGEIIREAQKKAGVSEGQGAPAGNKAREEVDAYLEERVTVKLFKDNDKYSEPVFVSVNGENCIIKRGEPVRVKRKFAIALAQSEAQDNYAANIKELYAREYEDRTRQQGL